MSEEVSKDGVLTHNFLRRDESTWKITQKLEDFLGRANEFEAIFYVGGWGHECPTLKSRQYCQTYNFNSNV
jgi:hypothetical protein